MISVAERAVRVFPQAFLKFLKGICLLSAEDPLVICTSCNRIYPPSKFLLQIVSLSAALPFSDVWVIRRSTRLGLGSLR